jgi:glycosyltransferase involved in cell wall biosynthesis
LNILFVLYNDFSSNSASHVHALANELTIFGHSCAVAVPCNKESALGLGVARYTPLTFEEALKGWVAFSNGVAPDIIHAWTPREIVREFCYAMQRRCNCRVFVHMEDNEWHLLSTALGMPLHDIMLTADEDLNRIMRPHLTHPRAGFEFLNAADGITVIIDRLKEVIPEHVPCLELWPAADRHMFKAFPKLTCARGELGIPINSSIIVYPGNVHAANAQEMRSLYLAVAILNREGMPTTLVRAGRDFYPFLGEQDSWARRHSVELGLLPHKKVPGLLALADLLVQPGASDAFNDYRFPSKLPEFLSVGRPVIVPSTNIAHRMIHGEHAYILRKSNAVAIAEAVKEILTNPELRDRLSRGAVEFSNKYLSWESSARMLHDFYIDSGCKPIPAKQEKVSHPLLALARSAACQPT